MPARHDLPIGRHEPGEASVRVRKPPPGSRSRLQRVVGMVRLARSRDFTALLDDLAQLHPRIGWVPSLNRPFYVVNHPALVQQVLVAHNATNEKGPGAALLRTVLGEGLLTAERSRHRQTRRLIQPAFHHRKTEQYAVLMAEVGRTWADQPRPAALTLDVAMSELTLTVVGRALFGADLTGDLSAIAHSLSTSLEDIGLFLVVPGGRQYLATPLPRARRFRRAQAQLRGVVAEVVARRQGSEQHAPGDLLSDLLAAQAARPDLLSDTQLADEIVTLLLAGHETTAMALTWAWLLLAQHPTARTRLHAEADALPQDDAAAATTPLPWATAVVAETMRLYPPVFAFERVTTVPLVLDEVEVPAGSTIRMSQWVLHRDPRSWSQADEFRPERWLDAAGAFSLSAPGQPEGAYVPFGKGSRICIGEQFAWVEASLLLARLAARYTVEPNDAGLPAMRPSVTLRPAHPVHVTLHARGGGHDDFSSEAGRP